MDTRLLWSRILFVIGSVAMVAGVLDPLEGSLVILAGSILVALGVSLAKSTRNAVIYWVWVVVLIAAGVTALFALSEAGGFGGPRRSTWWGMLILPYPIGWIMGLRGIVLRLLESYKQRHQGAASG